VSAIPNRRDAPYRHGETAVLFVDMQTIWCTPGLDPNHPEARADDYYHARLRAKTIPNQVALLNEARRQGFEVLHTIIEALTPDGRDRSPDHVLSNILVPRGLPEGQVIRELAPAPREIILPKTSSGVFNSTNIDYVLRNLNIRYLIIAGVITDQCVDMAVRDASDRGYFVSVPEDASATYSEERHQAALRAFGGYCWVTDTKTVLGRMGEAKA
jgi:biuret amidohydrolase